jgi:MFS family permease
MLSSEEQARGRRLLVWITCVSSAPGQIFAGSVLLLFLTSLSMDRVGTMICLSLPTLVSALLLVPLAHWADRAGKKKFGFAGIGLMVASFLGLAVVAAAAPPDFGRTAVVGLILMYAMGGCINTSGWFALIIPMIPEPVRAVFFARLRVTYQSVTVALGLACSAILEWHSSPGVFSGLFAAFLVMFVAWLILYTRLPEAEKGDPNLPAFGAALRHVVRARAYLPFCAYAFLLALFTGGCPILFGMIEKTILRLSDGTVTLLANVRLVGSILGFYLGGKIVARYGTKPMFLAAHFGFGAVMFLFLWRDAGGGPVVPILGVLEALFGLVWAASSVAFTVEMYALIPPENKSLSTSVFVTLQGTGAALGGVLPAWAIRLGMFRDTWTLGGVVRSDYDALLLICGTLVVVVAVTLGLVPSVTGRPEGPTRE